MTELENKIGTQQEPSKAEQSSTLKEAMDAHLAKGNKITKLEPKKVVGRKRKKGSATKPVKKPVSGGTKKPTLSAWKMLGIKKGQKLVWIETHPKICVKTSAIVLSENTMEMKVHYGKKTTTTDGIMRGEVWVRKQKKIPVPSSPQGWFKWGIEVKGKLQSIHQIWVKLDRQTVISRRGY